MHWKGLRISVFDGNDSKRHTVVESPAQSDQEVHQPSSSLHTPQVQSRHSESAPRSPRLADLDDKKRLSAPEGGMQDGSNPDDSYPPKSSSETQSLRRNRFSFWRLRHASDPHLNESYTKAGEDIPPVPPLPPPPMIITTSPTVDEQQGDPVKRNNKLKFAPGPKKEDSYTSALSQSEDIETRHVVQASTDSSLAASRASTEEPSRHVATPRTSGGDDRRPNDSQRASTDMRLSESSRSDQSVGDQGGPVAHEDSIFNGKWFRLPKIKMNRSSVFPISQKPRTGPNSKSKFMDVARKSVSTSTTPKSVALEGQEPDQVSPLPSPSRSTTRPSSPAHPMLRNSSTRSAPSIRSISSNSHQNPQKTRQRSSTLDSTVETQDDHQQQPPHLVSSGRTSSSTSGRKSFGDLLGISHRLRQNSEPPVPRIGSPAVGGAATPASTAGSFFVPQREEDDTPATYLARLREHSPRGAIAGALAQSDDEFYQTALRKYMREFSFFNDPIDMAIRKLLMEVVLPKETQQIDRVLQGFADRYHECNPGIFASSEQAYFIAFSILILHTDVFNKNNKRKMQKQDYVKNTRGESVSDDILEYFYENVSYTPFIHIEDTHVSSRYLAKPRRALFRTTSAENLPRPSREPVDPYTLILEDKLDTLKPNFKDVMNLDDTYSCTGPSGPADMKSLHEAFAKSGVLQILSPRSRPDAFMSPSSIDNPADSQPGLVDIRVAKVGLLWRKDPKKKRARSPWQEWGAILTFSQLYFFRDINWVRSLISQHDSLQNEGRQRTVIFRPALTEFKPDAIMSTYDAVALLDSGYKKHKHAFLFVRHNALEEVFLANTDADMEDWVAKLNYAAAFRATGVRSRGMMAASYDAQKYRNSNVDPFTVDTSAQSVNHEPPSPNIEASISPDLATACQHLMAQRVREANEKLFVCQAQLDDLLRNARHLQILTPIQPRTREQVIMAAGRMAAKVKWMRQDIWRIRSYKSVLLRDMGEETQDSAPEQIEPLPSTGADTSALDPSNVPTGEVNLSQGPESAYTTNGKPPPEDPTVFDESTQADSVPSAPPASVDLRRPSIPVSTTSSEFVRSGRKSSVDKAKERAKSQSADRATNVPERETSAFGSGSKMDVSSLASFASKLTSTGSIDDGEERILRQAGLLELDSSPRSRKQPASYNDTDADQKMDDQLSLDQGDQINRKRRSLHRTLRNSQHSHTGHHHRSRKRRSSVPDGTAIQAAQAAQAAKDEAGLPRKTPSFTVHGKKASIVTFGSEWQTMSPEERLKLRKPTPSDPAASEKSESIAPESAEQVQSLRRSSMVAKWSFPHHDDDDEGTGRGTKSLDLTNNRPVIDIPKASNQASTSIPVSQNSEHNDEQRPSSYEGPTSSSASASGVTATTISQNPPHEKLPASPAEQAVTA